MAFPASLTSQMAITPIPDSIDKAYASIATYEHHFNDMEMEVRKFASAWLLASLGAIAYLVRQQLTGSLLDAKLLIVIVCLMANLGLLILWILDQMVYHRLLNAVFLLGLRMEYTYPELPPIRTLMMLFSKKRGMARYLRFFYLVPMYALAVLAAVVAIWRIIERKSQGTDLGGVVVVVLVCAAIPAWAWMTAKQAEQYHEISAGFGDPDFVDYLKETRFEQVLKKH